MENVSVWKLIDNSNKKIFDAPLFCGFFCSNIFAIKGTQIFAFTESFSDIEKPGDCRFYFIVGFPWHTNKLSIQQLIFQIDIAWYFRLRFGRHFHIETKLSCQGMKILSWKFVQEMPRHLIDEISTPNIITFSIWAF